MCLCFQSLSNGLHVTDPSQGGPPLQHVNKTFTKEDVSSVIDKYLIRATTPARTIRTFFQPAIKQKDNGETNKSSDGTSKLANREQSTCKMGGNGGEPNHKAKSPDDSAGIMTAKCTASQIGGLKRARDGSTAGTPAKKIKQSNIMASFARSSSRDEVKKGRSCPICNHEFESGTTNAKINEHIDNCLIE